MAEDELFPDINDPAYADSMFVFFLGIGGQDSILVVSGG